MYLAGKVSVALSAMYLPSPAKVSVVQSAIVPIPATHAYIHSALNSLVFLTPHPLQSIFS